MNFARLFRSSPLIATGASLTALLLGAAILLGSNAGQNAAAANATALVAQLGKGAELTSDEYGIWKKIGNADAQVRLEIARLFQQRHERLVSFDSYTLIGNTVVGRDTDGDISGPIAEQLICATLDKNPDASAKAGLLYLQPWLNPASLGSEYCAAILTRSLLGANPDTAVARATLLAGVLRQLPAAEARLHVAAIAAMLASARPTDVELLFIALHRLDTSMYPAELGAAVELMIERILTASSATDVAALFDAIDYLKYSVSPADLTPVIDAALSRMLEGTDVALKHAIYFTLLDLKVSHPGLSFGARADYLMRGLNTFGTHIEIEDYAGVLLLDERYGADSSAAPSLATALLDGIRSLDAAEYGAGIKPYCRRFLQLSPELPYEILLHGAQLLFEQLHNPAFIYQRECLHDAALLLRLEPEARLQLAAVVISELESAGSLGTEVSLRHVADRIELLGLLDIQLDATQAGVVQAAITRAAQADADTFGLSDLVVAATRADIGFTPAFYSALFVTIADAAPEPITQLSALLQKLPDAQRSELVAAVLQIFFALEVPEELASQAQAVAVVSPWIDKDARRRVADSLVGAVDGTSDANLVHRLVVSLLQIDTSLWGVSSNAKHALLRKIDGSRDQSDLVQLFEAMRRFGHLAVKRKADQAILTAAAVRYLELTAAPATKRLDAIDTASQHATIRAAIRQLRVSLAPADVEKLEGNFINALRSDSSVQSVARYAGSIETLAREAKPGALGELLQVLHDRMRFTTDAAAHPSLLAAWLAVEACANAELPLEQRHPLYDEVLRLPLLSMDSRALLLERLEALVRPSDNADA